MSRVCTVHPGGVEDRGGYCNLWATQPGHGPCILITPCPHELPLAQAFNRIRGLENDLELFPLRPVKENNVLWFGHTGLFLRPCELKAKLAGVVDGYEVGLEAYFPGDYWTPPEYDVIDSGEFEALEDALSWVITKAQELRDQAKAEVEDTEALVRELQEEEALAKKLEAAEDCGCEVDELVRCEKCPSSYGIDDVCDECGETGWVYEPTR